MTVVIIVAKWLWICFLERIQYWWIDSNGSHSIFLKSQKAALIRDCNGLIAELVPKLNFRAVTFFFLCFLFMFFFTLSFSLSFSFLFPFFCSFYFPLCVLFFRCFHLRFLFPFDFPFLSFFFFFCVCFYFSIFLFFFLLFYFKLFWLTPVFSSTSVLKISEKARRAWAMDKSRRVYARV